MITEASMFQAPYLPESSTVKIRLLVVSFDFELWRREIPAFRAAVVEKVGRENILFHNHFGGGEFRYGYPLIQYKIFRRHPTIVCINEGSEEMLKFFQQTNWNIVLNGKEVEADIKHISFDYFYCGFSDRPVRHRIKNWFALNEANFEKFIGLDSDFDRNELLVRILIGNIISFAKGIQWDLNQEVKVTISNLPKGRLFNFKDHQMVGFDVDFSVNVLLPDGIGLGKSVSRGFGVIRKVA
jgi:hypothetical protein